MTERKTLMGKSNTVSPKKDLGGEILFETTDGTFKKTLIPFCDVCQIKLGDEVIICSLCRHKTCHDCSVRYEQKNVCVDCLKESAPLSKRQFKILVSVFSGVSWMQGLRAVTYMPKSAVERTISELTELGYVQRKRILWLEITDVGLDVLAAYRTVYPKDNDVENLNWELRSRERN